MAKESSPKISTPFINIMSDYGFKRTFGNRKYQNNVLRLLEATLGDEIDIKKIVPYDSKDTDEGTGSDENREVVQYHDKEVLPPEEDGKRIVYDVYFTIKAGKDDSSFKPRHLMKEKRESDVEHHFILEMQNVYIPPFEDRMTFYLANMVTAQGKAGWNYDLDPVILMGITDFDFPHLTPQPVQEFELREKTTGESLTKKMRMLFYSLNHVPDEWRKCVTELQRCLFLIKYMDTMNKNSEPYKDGRYRDLFEAAESSQIVGEEVVHYSRSLANMRNMKAGLEYRFEEGRAEGREEGRAEGREEGRAEGREEGREEGRAEEKARNRETMRRLLDMGIQPDILAKAAGLSIEEIEGL